MEGASPIEEPAVARRQGETPDRILVAAILDGDQGALRFLVERESAALVRLCYRILGDLGEAEDAAQEALVIAYRALGTWRGEGSLAGWLGRIAARVATRRARRLRAVGWVTPGSPDGSDPSPLWAARPDGSADPLTAALRAEEAARVRAAVARLPDPYREVVVLRFFADLPLAEIALQLGKPLGTVKTHLHRGLLRLRDELAEARR